MVSANTQPITQNSPKAQPANPRRRNSHGINTNINTRWPHPLSHNSSRRRRGDGFPQTPKAASC